MADFKLTNIKVKLYNNDTSKVKAFVDITLNNALVIRGLRIVDGKNGRFLAYPTVRKQDIKKMYDICFPIERTLKIYIEKEVFNEYEEVLKNEA